jgi:YfiH family protein
LITDRSHVLIAVSTADCVPLLLLDPIRKAVAAIHAGWRGTVLNISAKVVREMSLHYGSEPGDLMAGIGPSIGPCCYEVGNDVWQQVERKFVYGHEAVLHQRAGKAILDLARLNHLQLMEAGLRPERIFFSGLCTACFPNLFYSFRRDKTKTRSMMSGIMLTSEFHGEFHGR